MGCLFGNKFFFRSTFLYLISILFSSSATLNYSQCTSTTSAPGFSLHQKGSGTICDCIGTGFVTSDVTTLATTILSGDSADITFTPSLFRCGGCGYSLDYYLYEVPSGNLINTTFGSSDGCFTQVPVTLNCSPVPQTLSFRASANVTGITFEVRMFAAAPGCTYGGPNPTSPCVTGSISALSVCVYSANPCAPCTTPTATTSATYTWTGCKDTDWFDPCNWDTGALPTTAKDVVVPNTTNKPTVNGATANCREITINSSAGAIVTITSSGALNVTKP